MLEEGLGTIKDPDQALEWYEKAAKKVCTRLTPYGEAFPLHMHTCAPIAMFGCIQGFTEALYNMACLYDKGLVGDRYALLAVCTPTVQ